MANQIVPSSLREAMSEALERVSARVALLLYLENLPLDEHAADHVSFCSRLRSERDMLAGLVAKVVDAWRAGTLSVVAASHLIRSATAFVQR